MESSFHMIDNMVTEDFHETVVESTNDHLSMCSVGSDNSNSSKRGFNRNVGLDPNYNNTFQNYEYPDISLEDPISNNHLPICVEDNCETQPLTDTVSINSEDNESSGSSLHQFESAVESDVMLQDVTSTNHEYSVTQQKPTDTKPNSLSDKDNHVQCIARDQNILQDIKAAIKVKWMDRSVFIQKSIQQHNQDSWGDFVSNLDLQKCLVFQSSVEDSPKSPLADVKSVYFDDQQKETIHLASKSKQKMFTQEIEGFIKSTQSISTIPNVVDAPKRNNSLMLYKPPISVSCKVYFKDDPRNFMNDMLQKFEDKIDSNANCTSSCTKPSNQRSEYDDDGDDSQNDTIMRLQNDVQNKNMMLKTIQANLSNAIMSNERLRGSTGSLEDALKSSNTELHRSKMYIAKLEQECQSMKEANQGLVHLKHEMEGVITTEKQQRMSLQMKVDSLNHMESEYNWLCKMYSDYQALCHDYDSAKHKCAELESQIYEANGALESYKMKLGMMQEKIAFYQKKVEEQETSSHVNKNHCHESKCSCSNNHHRETSCFHSKSRSKSSRKKSKKRRDKSRRRDKDQYYHSNSYPNSQYSSGYSEESRYDDGDKSSATINQPADPKELDARYDQLQLKKRSLESELCHVPSSNIGTRNGSRSTEQIENELDQVDLELSSIRRQLKQSRVIND